MRSETYSLKNDLTGDHMRWVGKTEREGLLRRREAVLRCTHCDGQWFDESEAGKCLDFGRVRVDSNRKPIGHSFNLISREELTPNSPCSITADEMRMFAGVIDTSKRHMKELRAKVNAFQYQHRA